MRLHRSLVVGTAVAVAVLGLSGTAQAGDDGGGHHGNRAEVVEVRDDCDPATFNAQTPPIPCVGDGDTTFDEFLAEFLKTGEVDGWDFHPDRVHVDEGQKVKAVNVGGEFHTFTRVKAFGDACVPDLNLGKEPVIAECRDEAVAGALFQLTGLEPGGKLVVTSAHSGPAGYDQALQPGKNRFECLIHPWMRTVVVVEDDDHGHRGHH